MDESYFVGRDIQFADKCNEGNKVFHDRNRTYHDAIRRTGVLGAAVEIVGVSARLEPLVIQNKDLEHLDIEKLKNALVDLHNYANICLIMLEDKNWRGE
jgi:hypothetical protein